MSAPVTDEQIAAFAVEAGRVGDRVAVVVARWVLGADLADAVRDVGLDEHEAYALELLALDHDPEMGRRQVEAWIGDAAVRS